VQIHTQKFAPTLALKWYPQDLIGQVKLFDISEANRNRGGKLIFSPRVSRLTRKMERFKEESCHFAARIDNKCHFYHLPCLVSEFEKILDSDYARIGLSANMKFGTVWLNN